MSIGERISELRTARNISQSQLAKAMDVSRQAVSKWENGQSTPDPTKMIKLAELLDTDLEYLTTGRVVVPSRPPIVLETVKTVEKVVEKPVYIEKVVEKIVEKPVVKYIERPVIEYVDRPVIKRIERVKYRRNPTELIVVGIITFLLGLIIGFFL